MIRVLSVGLLAWFLVGLAFAENLPAPDASRGPAFSEKKNAGGCGNGLAVDSCKTSCPACTAFAAGAATPFSAPAFRDLPLVPALQFAEDVRAPDTAPPKRLPA